MWYNTTVDTYDILTIINIRNTLFIVLIHLF